jgi:hypothetical protein
MKLRVLILCALAGVSACHPDTSPTSVVKKLTTLAKAPAPAPAAPAPGPTAQEQTATMVEATTQGKSQVPVTLKFDVLQRPVQGRPLEIDIAILPQIPASPATVEISGAESLQLAPGENRIEFPEVEADQVYRHKIKLTPTAEGVYTLTLNVSLKHDQIADSRLFSLPVIVAGSNATPAGGADAAPQQAPAQPKGATP